MKTQRVSGLDIKVPKGSAFTIETPPNMPKMHQVMVAVGKRGSGKSYAVVNFLKYLQDARAMDRIFIISPTINSNKSLLDMLKIDQEDMYEEPTKEALDDILEKIEAEAAEYEEHYEAVKLWKKFKRFMKQGGSAPSDDELMLFWDGEDFVPPQHKWGGKRPVMGIIIDDCQGSDLFKPKSKLQNLVIRHRHKGQLKKQGGALGVSLFFCVQSYKATGGGLPRCVRGQATTMCIFKTKDENELKEIAEECSGEVSHDTFMKVYETAVEEPHSFLFIDFHPKSGIHPSMFRRRFNEFLIPEEIAKEEKKHANDK